jgi:hypothetical protein
LQPHAALIIPRSRLYDVTAADELFHQLTASRLMYGEQIRKVRHTDARVPLDLLQNPELRTGDTALPLHFAEVLANGTEDNSEVAQYGHDFLLLGMSSTAPALLRCHLCDHLCDMNCHTYTWAPCFLEAFCFGSFLGN